MITYNEKTKSYNIPIDGRTPQALYARALAGQGFYVHVENNGLVSPPGQGGSSFLSSMNQLQLNIALLGNITINGHFERAVKHLLDARKSHNSSLFQAASAAGVATLVAKVDFGLSDSRNQGFAQEKCSQGLAHQSAKAELAETLKAVPADKGFAITIKRTEAQARQEYLTCVAQVAEDRKEVGSNFQTGIEVLGGLAFAVLAGCAISSFRRSAQATEKGKAELTQGIAGALNQDNIFAELARQGQGDPRISPYYDPRERNFSITIGGA